MSDSQKDKTSKFDRKAFLKEIRIDLLKKLGLPEDTKPQQVMRLLEIKESIEKKNRQKH